MHLNHIRCISVNLRRGHTPVVKIGVLAGHIKTYTLAANNLLLTNKAPGPLSIYVCNATPKWLSRRGNYRVREWVRKLACDLQGWPSIHLGSREPP